jgi:hypothetical protein
MVKGALIELALSDRVRVTEPVTDERQPKIALEKDRQ